MVQLSEFKSGDEWNCETENCLQNNLFHKNRCDLLEIVENCKGGSLKAVVLFVVSAIFGLFCDHEKL